MTKRDVAVILVAALIALLGGLCVVMAITLRRQQQVIYTLYEGKEQVVVSQGQGGRESPIEAPTPSVEVEETLCFLFPIAEEDYYYTSPFGIRVSPTLHIELHHDGLDIASVWRAQVIVVADGKVKEFWPPPDEIYSGHKIYGGMILIDHGDGIESLYGHLHSCRVVGYQEVKAGEVIGRIGRTGVATGDHLHFEIIVNGKQVNPLLYIEGVK